MPTQETTSHEEESALACLILTLNGLIDAVGEMKALPGHLVERVEDALSDAHRECVMYADGQGWDALVPDSIKEEQDNA